MATPPRRLTAAQDLHADVNPARVSSKKAAQAHAPGSSDLGRAFAFVGSMQRWEYHRTVIDAAALIHGELDNEMKRLGDDGWELTVAVPREKHGYAHEVCLLFKRCKS